MLANFRLVWYLLLFGRILIHIFQMERIFRKPAKLVSYLPNNRYSTISTFAENLKMVKHFEQSD